MDSESIWTRNNLIEPGSFDPKVVMYGPASPSDAMAKQVRAEFESKDSANVIARFGMQFEPGSDSATFAIETRTP